MFFVFECGNPQEGEATGGLGDMKHKAETLDLAKSWAEAHYNWLYSIEILDGATGAVWSIGSDGEWSPSYQ